jgi:hypothetical protein
VAGLAGTAAASALALAVAAPTGNAGPAMQATPHNVSNRLECANHLLLLILTPWRRRMRSPV